MLDLSPQDEEMPEVSEYTTGLRALHKELHAEMIEAQMAQAEQANKVQHPDPELKVGEKVWLRRKNIQTTRP